MTDDKGNIELPPLPQPLYQQTYTGKQMLDYTYAAILADRKRRVEQDRPKKQKIHEARLSLDDSGDWSVVHDDRAGRITLRWTADGKARIESERNRESARRLRREHPSDYFIYACADALDGGER